MRVALVQFAPKLGEVQANTETMIRLVDDAASKGAAIVIFPEMSDTGYHPSVFERFAQPWPGEVYNALQDAARSHSIAILSGLSEKSGEEVFNSLVLFSAEGEELAKYRKTHLFSPAPVFEHEYFVAGSAFEVVELAGVSIGLSICYDLRFPEMYRCLSEGGAEVLINVAAWPRKRADHWDWLTRVRAVENQAFFLGVSSVGEGEGDTLNGNSRVVSPRGELLGSLQQERNAVVVCDLDFELLSSFRKELPLDCSRRPELYQLRK